MRSLLLAIVAGLAVLAVRINADDAPLDDADLEIDFDADAIARMLGDLFDDEDYARDSKEVAPKEVMVFDQEGQALYNNLFDTIFSRINSLSTSYLNPFTFRMKGNESDRIRKDNKKSGKKGKKETQDKNKKKRKNGRHPKDLDLGEEEEDSEDQTPVEAEEDDEEVVEDHSISKREVEFDLVEIEEDDDDDHEESDLEEDEEEESLVRMTRDVRMEDEAFPAEAASRRGKPAKGKKGSTKKGSKKKKNGEKKRKGSKKKSNKNVKKNRPKNKGKKGKSNKGKKGNKKSGKKDKKEGKDKNKNNKKNRRHPKDLDLGEEEEDTPVEAEDDDEEVAEDHDISKREVEFDLVEIEEDEDDDDEESDLEEDDEKESAVRITRSADMKNEASSPAEETSRTGKPAKGKKGSTKKGGKKNGGKKRKGGKKKNNKKSSNKNSNKKGRKNKNKSKRDAKGSAIHTSKASVTGIDTIKRQGDVKISNKQGGKEMRAQFTLGPVDLKVSRKYGKGKDSVTKEARAVAPELTGKLAIQVLSDSTTNLLSFRINRPAIVQVDGTIRKTNKLGKSNNNFMERSIGRFSPVLSRKLSIATTNILALVNQKLAKKSIK